MCRISPPFEIIRFLRDELRQFYWQSQSVAYKRHRPRLLMLFFALAQLEGSADTTGAAPSVEQSLADIKSALNEIATELKDGLRGGSKKEGKGKGKKKGGKGKSSAEEELEGEDADVSDLYPVDDAGDVEADAADADGEMVFGGEAPIEGGEDLGEMGEDVADVGEDLGEMGEDVADVGEDVADVGEDLAEEESAPAEEVVAPDEEEAAPAEEGEEIY